MSQFNSHVRYTDCVSVSLPFCPTTRNPINRSKSSLSGHRYMTHFVGTRDIKEITPRHKLLLEHFFFISIVFYWVSLSILMVFLIPAIYYAYNMLNIINLLTCSWPNYNEGPTQIHHSTNSETAIPWSSWKHNRALKSYPNVKVHLNYILLFC